MYVFIYGRNDSTYDTYIIRQDLMNDETWRAAYYGIHALYSPAINQNETILYYLNRHAYSTTIITVNTTDAGVRVYK